LVVARSPPGAGIGTNPTMMPRGSTCMTPAWHGSIVWRARSMREQPLQRTSWPRYTPRSRMVGSATGMGYWHEDKKLAAVGTRSTAQVDQPVPNPKG
jgi:hypothetical protein